MRALLLHIPARLFCPELHRAVHGTPHSCHKQHAAIDVSQSSLKLQASHPQLLPMC